MSLSPRFIEYFQTTFFQGKEEEFECFLASLEKGIPRTLRIKPGLIDDVHNRLEAYGFILSPTTIANVFTLDRREDFDPMERRIGFTLDHLVGNFYIQELAAATSVDILSEGKIHKEKFVILDMAASPGGKTTQLAEQYPESFIIANEPTRERIPQLLQNLDRMGSANIGVTLYPGQYFKHTPEVFDRILLDAPCSGEGTLYKGTDATKHWHIKNIKTIARLQEKLIDAAFSALKVGGEMVYSTCSMNLLENEGVLDSLKKKYEGCFEILLQKRYWPHIDKTGGFFVAKIRKILPVEGGRDRRESECFNGEIQPFRENLLREKISSDTVLYKHTNKILALKNHPDIDQIRKQYYFMRFGEKIATLSEKSIQYEAFAHRYIDTKIFPEYRISDEASLDRYLRGEVLSTTLSEGMVRVMYQNILISLEEVRNGKLSNRFPQDWRRK